MAPSVPSPAFYVPLMVVGVAVVWLMMRVLVFFLARPSRERLAALLAAGETGVPLRDSAPVLLVLGSGGHTTEMLRVAQSFHVLGPANMSLRPLVFVAAETDEMSEIKLRQVPNLKQATLELIPRSREVGQSYMSSVFSTLRATAACWPLLRKHRPEMLIVNGPGSCIPLCLVATLAGILGLQRTAIVYIESICRVSTLSLSAKLLRFGIADVILVQWPELGKKHKDTIYIGRVV